MASYVITGASMGLGFEFMRQASADPNNTVIGLVRNKPATEAEVAKEMPDRSNIHILAVDLIDYKSIAAAAVETSKITRGKLDYLISNASHNSFWSAFNTLNELGEDPERLEEDILMQMRVNVVGVIHLFNAFTPLILNGKVKKVIALGTGYADPPTALKLNIATPGPYTISKTALNAVVANYHAQYGHQGVLFISIAPGIIATREFPKLDETQNKYLMENWTKFQQEWPHFKGPSTAEDAVKAVLAVAEKKSVENGDGGTNVSHYGNKVWL